MEQFCSRVFCYLFSVFAYEKDLIIEAMSLLNVRSHKKFQSPTFDEYYVLDTK